MRKVHIATALLAVAAAAFGAELSLTGPPQARAGHNYSYDAVLVDNLVTSASQIFTGLSANISTDRWFALDFTPREAVTVNRLRFHYLYNSVHRKDALYFRLYRGANPRAGSLLRSWTVATGNYAEIDTGWIAFGRTVWLAVVPIPNQDLTSRTKYWFAYTSGSTETVFWCVRNLIKEDMLWWYLNGSWGSTAEKGYPTVEQSYMIEGGSTGVAPVSFGEIKALFK
ncbi:MAG: hypothetical protein V3W11_08460 [bacterium]